MSAADNKTAIKLLVLTPGSAASIPTDGGGVISGDSGALLVPPGEGVLTWEDCPSEGLLLLPDCNS